MTSPTLDNKTEALPEGKAGNPSLEEGPVSSPEAEVSYNLRISTDKVCVLLDCPDPLADLEETVASIMADFGRLEIPVHPDTEQLAAILRKVSTPGSDLVDQPLIMGQKARPSIDGHLDWARDFFTEGWAVDEDTGIIDYWEKLENRSVHQGDLLVKLMDPDPGEPGLNVFGNEIPVAKPSSAKLRCGKGVRVEETPEGQAYFAQMNGRVCFRDGTVSVDDVFLVQGNVSLATGNIRHAGTVQIMGDVEAGATVEAEGDVMIKGMVDPCTISCGGALTVVGGLRGDPESRIQVGGDFNARYVSEARMTVGGNLTVSNEIDHSEIKVRGRAQIPSGRIAGGLVQGYKGVRVGQAGASGASHTTLIAGRDWQLEEELSRRETSVQEMEAEQNRMQDAARDLEDQGDLDDPEVRQKLDALLARAKQQGQQIADEFVHIRSLSQKSKVSAVMEVVIYEEIHSGTIIHLGEFHTQIRTTILKPRIAQLRSTRVRVLPLGERNMPED